MASSAQTEAAALRIWEGGGAPRLYASDTQALLIEHISPAEHSPAMSAKEVAALVTQIARPIDDQNSPVIPHIYHELWKRYLRAYANRHDEISETLLMTTATMTNHMLGDRALRSCELVHGDFKTKNILKRPDGTFVVIDPSPAIGNKLYDVALWAIEEPESILERCEETAHHFRVGPQIIGSLAVALAIPEICLASPARAQKTLESVREITGTANLLDYFLNDFIEDDFMGGSYHVSEPPNM